MYIIAVNAEYDETLIKTHYIKTKNVYSFTDSFEDAYKFNDFDDADTINDRILANANDPSFETLIINIRFLPENYLK